MTCLIDLNLFYIIIEIFNIKSLVTSIIPELFWFMKNFTFDNSTYNVANIRREVIKTFLKLCEHCSKEKTF